MMNARAKEVSGTGRVCPHQAAFMLDNWIRRLFQNPRNLVGEYIQPGDTAVDMGCGPGFFTIDMARMVGRSGQVIAVDLQTGMLQHVRKKARRHGLANRIKYHQCRAEGIGLECQANFVLAFYMVHETPDPHGFFTEIRSILAPGGKLLVVEPKMHVSRSAFEDMTAKAVDAGMQITGNPSGKGGRAVLLAGD
jgi:ubiquinone/menaquinone biosynthesis C-methylase UbiE